jgi:hypothetical protein
MADTDSLIVNIVASQREFERQMASVLRTSERTAKAAERAFEASNQNVGRSYQRSSQQAVASLNQTSNASKQLSFQLADIGTQLASGTSPLLIMSQQGSQVVQALQGAGGAAGAFRAVLGSLASPLTLVTLAITAANLAASAFFSESEEEAKDLNAELKAQRDLVRQVVDEWDKAPAALKRAVAAEKELETVAKRREALQLQRKSLLAPLNDEMVQLEPRLLRIFDLFDGFPAFEADIEALRNRWTLLRSEVENGGASAAEVEDFFKQLNTTIAALPTDEARRIATILRTEVSPAIQSSTTDVRELDKAMDELGVSGATAFEKLLKALEAFAGPLGPLIEAIRTLSGEIGNFSPGGAFLSGAFALPELFREAVVATPSASKSFLKSRTESAKIKARIDEYDDAYAQLLAKLFTALPSAQIISGPRTFAEQKAIYDSGIRPAARPGTSRHEQVGDRRPQAADIGGVSPAALQAAVDLIPGLETLARIGDKMHVQLRSTTATTAAVKEQSTAFDDLFAANQRRLDQQLLLNEITADSTITEEERTRQLDEAKVAAEAATISEQLLAAAKTQGLEETEELTAKIQGQARAMAEAGLSAQQLATKQREFAKSQAETARQLQAFNDQMATVFKSAISGFISDLRRGEDAGEAFANMLDRIIDGLINMALEALFSKQLLGGLFGGGGFAFAGPWGAATMAAGGIVGDPSNPRVPADPAWWKGAPSFATGGMVMPSGAIPILAHAGEVIVPRNRVGQLGSDTINNNNRISVSVNTGPDRIIADVEQGKQLGRMIDGAVQVILLRESRPGGLLRKPG